MNTQNTKAQKVDFISAFISDPGAPGNGFVMP